MRVFIAINFNDDIKDRLQKAEKELKNMSAKGNFTSRDNLHLTLVFLGEIGEERVKLAQLCVKNIVASGFDMQFNRLGKFERDGGNIYWVGTDNNNDLKWIYEQLYKNLTSYDFYLRDLEYVPHLTLGREIELKPDADVESYRQEFPTIDIHVDRINLMKSERIDGKLTYTVLYTKELGK
ncbi:MAG: RNA 2',3'-cyclic phosphodiesterase [Candidatus Cloacimonetes bacterium]|jgi:2'-5' RNA ligase|nr:RNA 2',3'-cyclic phosphodiesterase [Candidatus Cloacimonadota bacterium]